VLEWARCVVDAHLARLLMARGLHPAVAALRDAVAAQVGGVFGVFSLGLWAQTTG
jgi:hypothetical protein